MNFQIQDGNLSQCIRCGEHRSFGIIKGPAPSACNFFLAALLLSKLSVWMAAAELTLPELKPGAGVSISPLHRGGGIISMVGTEHCGRRRPSPSDII